MEYRSMSSRKMRWREHRKIDIEERK